MTNKTGQCKQLHVSKSIPCLYHIRRHTDLRVWIRICITAIDPVRILISIFGRQADQTLVHGYRTYFQLLYRNAPWRSLSSMVLVTLRPSTVYSSGPRRMHPGSFSQSLLFPSHWLMCQTFQVYSRLLRDDSLAGGHWRDCPRHGISGEEVPPCRPGSGRRCRCGDSETARAWSCHLKGLTTCSQPE